MGGGILVDGTGLRGGQGQPLLAALGADAVAAAATATPTARALWGRLQLRGGRPAMRAVDFAGQTAPCADPLRPWRCGEWRGATASAAPRRRGLRAL